MQDIHAKLGLGFKLRIHVPAEQSTRATELLTSLPQVRDVQMSQEHLIVTMQDGAAPDGLLARTLVQGGVDLLLLVPEQIKLDEAFLQLTKGLVQ
jgi:hypothetical protein